MIEWDAEREHRRKVLLSHISDTTSIDSQGKQSAELTHLADQPFASKNCLFERDLYYLFADYYLKMSSKDAAANESSKKKAQEYYIKDLCLNTRRFDSWAGLTVIEFYKIEEFITVITHPIISGEFQVFCPSRRMISIPGYSMFICQLRVSSDKRSLSIRITTHSGWNTRKSPTSCKRIVRNT